MTYNKESIYLVNNVVIVINIDYSGILHCGEDRDVEA